MATIEVFVIHRPSGTRPFTEVFSNESSFNHALDALKKNDPKNIDLFFVGRAIVDLDPLTSVG